MSLVQIYTAETSADADLIKGLLAQQGIETFLSGHYLQGAFGELPCVNRIQVMVETAQEQQARQILRDHATGKDQIDDADNC